MLSTMHKIITSFDHHVANFVARLPHWLHPIMLAATLIGEPVVVLSIAAGVGVTAWVRGAHRIAYAEAAAMIGFGGNTALKYIFHRARPHTMYAQHMKIKSYSFPSGHAYGGMVIYGLLAYLTYKYLPHPWNVLTTLLLAMLIIIIGVSRVYLGAHFPSDVAAGWLLGAITLILIVVFIKP
jgi:membrane-associated phospholipid phosphatase